MGFQKVNDVRSKTMTVEFGSPAELNGIRWFYSMIKCSCLYPTSLAFVVLYKGVEYNLHIPWGLDK